MDLSSSPTTPQQTPSDIGVSTSANMNHIPSLQNPFASERKLDFRMPEELERSTGPYEEALELGIALNNKPFESAGIERVAAQHAKERMTIWERIGVLTSEQPDITFVNWGPNLDGASLVTGILKIGDRDVAFYGHDFTVRAGSMDATNGRKLARLFELAGEKRIPVIGMNDSAGAYVPAGVGGLDGYSEAFTALRRISGVVPSIMCMFGFNAGGGAYLPRQGTFVIQPSQTFFGLTGAGVVKSVLGEDITPDQLGGPGVHGQSGVTDITVPDELGALRTAIRLLSYLPDHNSASAPFQKTSDPVQRETWEIDLILKKALDSTNGFNTPFDTTLLLQHICDHGDFFEIQPQRARNAITAFGRLGGHVTGFVANNSAVNSAQIDIAAAHKIARFVRICNLYNIPVIFLEDTTGFAPGREQESLGIVQAGRAMLDSIIDLRTPRLLLILRNAFGGAYAAFNNIHTGADTVYALPTARIAVMGPAGREFVYKNEVSNIRKQRAQNLKTFKEDFIKAGNNSLDAEKMALKKAEDLYKTADSQLISRYEKELMNPNEALSLGSISKIIMPKNIRKDLFKALDFQLRHYVACPMSGTQREFH